MEPYLVILIGIYLLFVAISNPDWIFNRGSIRHNSARILVRYFGRNNARIIIGLVGIFLLYGSIAHLIHS